MRKLTSIILFLLSFGPAIAQDDVATKNVLSNVLVEYIQPRYADLFTKSQTLRSAATELCQSASKQNLELAQSEFIGFANSWARIEWFRVGPIMSKNRVERILFYPDRKSTGLKQVQRALLNQDQTVTNFNRLAQKSVAVQGLGALEFILFGTGFEDLQSATGSHRCRFANAVAQNLEHISKTLSDGWANGSMAAQFWINPNDENPLFRDDNEALNVLIGTLVHGLEALKDVRIGAFLKEEAKLDRPKSALMWRSENTIGMIENGLEGLNELFDKSGIETLLGAENRNISDAIRFEFNQAINTARILNKSVFDILADNEERQKVSYLKLAIGFTMSRIDENLSRQLGLSAGFSFGDGD